MKTLRIEGEIGLEITNEILNSQIRELNLKPEDELKVIINSGGGSVFEGYAMYNTLKAIPNRKVGQVSGVCASIATLIFNACDYLTMSEVSMFMVHKASTMVDGNSDELQKQLEVLNLIDNTLNTVYSSRTGKTSDEIKLMLGKETFLNSHQALSQGWIDEIVDKVPSKVTAVLQDVVASINQINNKNMGSIKDFFKANFGMTEIGGEAQKPQNIEEEVMVETSEGGEVTVEEKTTLSIEELNDKVDRLIEVVDALKEAMMGEEEAIPTEVVTAQVQEEFEKLVASLPSTKGTVPMAQGTFDKTTPTYVPRGAKFMARMKEIDNQNRRK